MLPPLPKGFSLQRDSQEDVVGLPPLPDGFTLEQPTTAGPEELTPPPSLKQQTQTAPPPGFRLESAAQAQAIPPPLPSLGEVPASVRGIIGVEPDPSTATDFLPQDTQEAIRGEGPATPVGRPQLDFEPPRTPGILPETVGEQITDYYREKPFAGRFVGGMRTGPIGKVYNAVVQALAPDSEDAIWRQAEQVASNSGTIGESGAGEMAIGTAGHLAGILPVFVGAPVHPIALFGGMNAISQAADLFAGVEDEFKPEGMINALLFGTIMRYGVPAQWTRIPVEKGGGALARVGARLGLTGLKALEATIGGTVVNGAAGAIRGDTEAWEKAFKQAPQTLARTAATFAALEIFTLAQDGLAGRTETALKKYGNIPQATARQWANEITYGGTTPAGFKQAIRRKSDIIRSLEKSFSKTCRAHHSLPAR